MAVTSLDRVEHGRSALAARGLLCFFVALRHGGVLRPCSTRSRLPWPTPAVRRMQFENATRAFLTPRYPRHSTPPSRTTPRTDFLVRALLSVRSRASPRRKHALHDRRVMHAGLGVHLRPDASLVVWPRSPSLRLESSTMPVSGIEELQGAGGPQCAQSITAHAAAIERQFRCG